MTEHLLRVLYVEDDINDRTMFGIMAEKTERVAIWLYTVSNAQEAREYLEGKAQYADRAMYQLPEIVVIDLNMPGGGGLDFLEWRKSSHQFASLPVIIFSGTLPPKDLERAKTMGVAAVFEKPALLAGWMKAIRDIYSIGMKHRPKGSRPRGHRP